MKKTKIARHILVALIALFLAGESKAAESIDTQKTELKPSADMQMWFYPVEEQFKYPIPCDFEFCYIDSSGAIKVTGPFHRAHPYKNGLAKVELSYYKLDSGSWKLNPRTTLLRVLIDKNGKIAKKAKPEFESPKIKTKVVNGKKVFIYPETQIEKRKKSKHLDAGTIPKELKRFDSRVNGKWGYEDEEGNEYISAQFDDAYPFAEGLARITKRSIAQTSGPVLKEIEKLNTTFKNSDKKAKAEAQKKAMVLWEKLKKRVRHSDFVGYINTKGETIIPPEKYLEGKDFSDGLAAVYRDDKWGYIDSKGKEVIEPKFDKVGDFGDGLAPVSIDNKYGYINRSGEIEILNKFALAGKFVGGLAPATLDGINWGYINKTGQFTISPKFKRAFEFSDGLALVMIPPRTDIDKNPNEAANFYLSSVYLANNGNEFTAKKALKTARELDSSNSSSGIIDMYTENVKSINEILKNSGDSIKSISSPTKNQ